MGRGLDGLGKIKRSFDSTKKSGEKNESGSGEKTRLLERLNHEKTNQQALHYAALRASWGIEDCWKISERGAINYSN